MSTKSPLNDIPEFAAGKPLEADPLHERPAYQKYIYLAGPMSGKPEFNFPAFHEAAGQLRDKGHIVFSPAEKDMEEYGDDAPWMSDPNGDIDDATAAGFDLNEAMKQDLTWICDEADAIAMLPGWEHSSGARTEHTLACCLRLEIMYL